MPIAWLQLQRRRHRAGYNGRGDRMRLWDFRRYADAVIGAQSAGSRCLDMALRWVCNIAGILCVG